MKDVSINKIPDHQINLDSATENNMSHLTTSPGELAKTMKKKENYPSDDRMPSKTSKVDLIA